MPKKRDKLGWSGIMWLGWNKRGKTETSESDAHNKVFSVATFFILIIVLFLA